MDPLQPEVRLGQFARLIAEQLAHVLAYEGRRVSASRLEAADHGWRRGQQIGQPRLRRETGFLGTLDLRHVRVNGDGPAIPRFPLVDLDPAAVALRLQRWPGR